MGTLLFGLDLANESILGDLHNSYNDFSIQYLKNLSLTHNKLKTFPRFLINLYELFFLDLSNNQIHGEIPNWIWEHYLLYSLNLSYNYLETLDLTSLSKSDVRLLDLGSNQLQGKLNFPETSSILGLLKE
jgi:hypothetical protein